MVIMISAPGQMRMEWEYTHSACSSVIFMLLSLHRNIECTPNVCINDVITLTYYLIQGSPDYLGRAFAFPLLKLPNETYEPPMFPALLQWWPIMRGQAASGELLASFELMQVKSAM